MNKTEFSRISTVSLPNPLEKDQKTLNKKIIETLGKIFKRDEDKEKRIRAIEEKKDVGRLGLTLGTRMVTSNFNASQSDDLIVCNANIFIIGTMFKATGSGKVIFIKNISASNVQVNGYETDTIDNNPNQTLFAWEGVIFVDYVVGRWIVT